MGVLIKSLSPREVESFPLLLASGLVLEFLRILFWSIIVKGIQDSFIKLFKFVWVDNVFKTVCINHLFLAATSRLSHCLHIHFLIRKDAYDTFGVVA